MSNTTTQIRAAVVREKGGPFSIETLSLERPTWSKSTFAANKQGQAAVARANHKIKETRSASYPLQKG